jgi:hypothetical protein
MGIIQGKVVEWLDPKSITYRHADADSIDFRDQIGWTEFEVRDRVHEIGARDGPVTSPQGLVKSRRT